eukprot:Skav205312  [mRNA]  locus=scaffold3444:127669:132657:+ [translate_table: standard]
MRCCERLVLNSAWLFSLCQTLAVAWSNWELVLSLMDALEPDHPDHDLTLVRVVIALCLVVSFCFYLRFGPEPIIPDPQLQHLCYSHGYSSSVQRAFVSYIAWGSDGLSFQDAPWFVEKHGHTNTSCDPTYGLLIALASAGSLASMAPLGLLCKCTCQFDGPQMPSALLVLCGLAMLVTLLSALPGAYDPQAMRWFTARQDDSDDDGATLTNRHRGRCLDFHAPFALSQRCVCRDGESKVVAAGRPGC